LAANEAARNGGAGDGGRAGGPVCFVLPYEPSLTETFIRSHVAEAPAGSLVVYGWRPKVGGRNVLSLPAIVFHKVWRELTGAGLERENTASYLKAFRRHRVAAVLAEYGDTGVLVTEACRRAGVPLIVHFHGYDASVREVLEENAETYPAMFRQAAAVIAVSRAMRAKLISLGAPPEKVYYNPYGVDCEQFAGADPAAAPPLFVAVGRLTQKKSPQATLAAFAEVLRGCPAARLRMIGDGPLMGECRELVRGLGIGDAVALLGPQPHSVIKEEMRRARCFVQHSVEAPSGDCEGTPVSVIEAGASGLPVVSTRHAGIPDVVVEGETGFLVAEGDVRGMAAHMLRLAREPELAGELGRAARRRVESHFSKGQSLARLWAIVESCIEGGRSPAAERTPTAAWLEAGDA
jgi:glycosyltransferase involved in cell wall biosynthesis